MARSSSVTWSRPGTVIEMNGVTGPGDYAPVIYPQHIRIVGTAPLPEATPLPISELLEIESFDEDTINELRSRAKDALLTAEIAREENVESVSQDLRDLDGLDPALIPKLAEAGVHTRDDLADLAVDELTEITGQSADEAKNLILKAREHWFAGQE